MDTPPTQGPGFFGTMAAPITAGPVTLRMLLQSAIAPVTGTVQAGLEQVGSRIMGHPFDPVAEKARADELTRLNMPAPTDNPIARTILEKLGNAAESEPGRMLAALPFAAPESAVLKAGMQSAGEAAQLAGAAAAPIAAKVAAPIASAASKP